MQSRDPDEIDPLERGDHAELAAVVINELAPKGHLVYDEGGLYRYRDGAWELVPRIERTSRVLALAGRPVSAGMTAKGLLKYKALRINDSDLAGIDHLVQERCSVPGFFLNAPAGVAFANGFLEVTPAGCVLHPSAMSQMARHRYTFDFNDNPNPTRWLGFWDQVFAGDPDAAAKLQAFREFGGAVILGAAAQFSKAFVLHGAGANGKSVALHLLRQAVPPGSYVAISPRELSDQYRRARLAGKLLNVVSEMPAAAILQSEDFKAMVSGDEVEGRHPYGQPFSFRPRAGHIFSANQLPTVTDHTAGFWRRTLVLNFNRQFSESEQDVTLAETLTSELPQIVCWFLTGAASLFFRGHYDVPESSKRTVAQWRTSSDSVRLYLDDRTAPHPDTTALRWPTGATLYADYTAWGDANGHRRLTSATFFSRLKAIGVTKRISNGARYALLLKDSTDHRSTENFEF